MKALLFIIFIASLSLGCVTTGNNEATRGRLEYTIPNSRSSLGPQLNIIQPENGGPLLGGMPSYYGR